LAISRLETNHRAISEALASLRQALTLGEDTMVVLRTAVVEAGFTMGIGITDSQLNLNWQWYDLHLVWNPGAGAYPTDTTPLRRGIQLMDFALAMPDASVDWSHVLALPGGGPWLLNLRTPSLAALDEMIGIAHLQLGRAYIARATQTPSCALWTDAHDALTKAYTSLKRRPEFERADPSDRRLAASAGELAHHADSTRVLECHA
jgi:hypothetical protein